MMLGLFRMIQSCRDFQNFHNCYALIAGGLMYRRTWLLGCARNAFALDDILRTDVREYHAVCRTLVHNPTANTLTHAHNDHITCAVTHEMVWRGNTAGVWLEMQLAAVAMREELILTAEHSSTAVASAIPSRTERSERARTQSSLETMFNRVITEWAIPTPAEIAAAEQGGRVCKVRTRTLSSFAYDECIWPAKKARNASNVASAVGIIRTHGAPPERLTDESQLSATHMHESSTSFKPRSKSYLDELAIQNTGFEWKEAEATENRSQQP
jgi:hypothetical protein